MQANDRQEQKVARRTYIAYALPTGLVVNITWLVDVFFRLFQLIRALDSYPFSIIYYYYVLEIDIFVGRQMTGKLKNCSNFLMNYMKKIFTI